MADDVSKFSTASKKQATFFDIVENGADRIDPTSRNETLLTSVQGLSVKQKKLAERALVRKIDLRLLPALIIMYILNYLDRNNIATARLAGSPGLQEDLGLTNSQYETCVSILFVGYILMQIPSNLFLNKVGKPAIYLPVVMMIWGAISTATAAAQSYASLVAIRFCLGFVEAAYFPGCLFFCSCWYTRKELALRSAILYSGSLISGAFGGLIAAGITTGMNGKAGLPAWRWLFIIEGGITVLISFAAFFVLPNLPRTTSWLSEQERQLAVLRLQEDVGMDDWVGRDQQFFWDGFYLAAKDVKVWLLMIMLLSVVSSASVTNFFPSVVQTLGFSNFDTLLLTAPPYVLAVFAASLNAYHADKTGERTFHIVIPLAFAIAAFVLAVATTATAPRYVAMMLMVPSFYAGFVIILAWISNTIPRPPSKRAAALAAINAISNTASIYASYMYGGSPRYVLAFSVNCATACLAIAMAVLLRAILVRANRKLEREEILSGIGRKGFRYLV